MSCPMNNDFRSFTTQIELRSIGATQTITDVTAIAFRKTCGTLFQHVTRSLMHRCDPSRLTRGYMRSRLLLTWWKQQQQLTYMGNLLVHGLCIWLASKELGTSSHSKDKDYVSSRPFAWPARLEWHGICASHSIPVGKAVLCAPLV